MKKSYEEIKNEVVEDLDDQFDVNNKDFQRKASLETNHFKLMRGSGLKKSTRLLIPIFNVKGDKYLIGTKIRQAINRKDGLHIKIGAGYEHVSEHIRRSSETMCLRIYNRMKE